MDLEIVTHDRERGFYRGRTKDGKILVRWVRDKDLNRTRMPSLTRIDPMDIKDWGSLTRRVD